MAKQIIMKHGKRKELAIRFKTSYHTVRDALVYKTDTDLARKIRFCAVKHYGGIEVEY